MGGQDSFLVAGVHWPAKQVHHSLTKVPGHLSPTIVLPRPAAAARGGQDSFLPLPVLCWQNLLSDPRASLQPSLSPELLFGEHPGTALVTQRTTTTLSTVNPITLLGHRACVGLQLKGVASVTPTFQPADLPLVPWFCLAHGRQDADPDFFVGTPHPAPALKPALTAFFICARAWAGHWGCCKVEQSDPGRD